MVTCIVSNVRFGLTMKTLEEVLCYWEAQMCYNVRVTYWGLLARSGDISWSIIARDYKVDSNE